MDNLETVVVDLGNSNIKFLGNNKRGCFSSKTNTKLETNIEAFENITYKDVTTCIGVGALDREYNKVSKKLMAQVLYAIAKATEESEINLCLLLPLIQLGNRDILINKFANKNFIYSINTNERTIKINKVFVLGEGQVAKYSLTDASPFTLLIDIGGRTVNWCAYSKDKLEKSGTERIGILDLYTTIKNIENSRGEDFIEEDIESQILRKRINVEERVYRDFMLEILNRIKLSLNIKNYDVVFSGGGSLVLKDIIASISNVEMHDNPLYANVMGAANIVRSMMR